MIQLKKNKKTNFLVQKRMQLNKKKEKMLFNFFFFCGDLKCYLIKNESLTCCELT